MTDVMTRLAAANPVACEEEPSAGELTGALERVRAAPTRTPRRAAPRLVRDGIALAGAAGAATAGVLVLSAGSVTPAAEAFPILRGPATNISKLIRVHAAADGTSGVPAEFSSPGSFLAALQDAHSFAMPDVAGETGYVVESPDGGTLCLVLARQFPTATPPLSDITLGLVGCSATSEAQQDGLVVSVPSDSENAFAAIVPAGATASLTDDGTTTPVALNDGVATGVVPDTATVTIDVAGTTTSYPIPMSENGAVWAWATSSSTAPTGTTGGTAPIGATGTSGQAN